MLPVEFVPDPMRARRLPGPRARLGRDTPRLRVGSVGEGEQARLDLAVRALRARDGDVPRLSPVVPLPASRARPPARDLASSRSDGQ